ncbi:MAG: EAL domain-containing response regulator [Methyloligellaceae bacterium]
MSRETVIIESVLIVDDDPILCALAEVFFAARGAAHVHTSQNGREALQVVQSGARSIDFVLCDLNMPEMDGLQFLRHLKECGYEGQVAVLSGEQEHIRKTARRLAASYDLNLIGTLKKPFDKAALEQLIQDAETRNAEPANVAAIDVTEDDLRIALEGGAVVPFYQPKVDAATQQLVGVEALARWPHAVHGMIPPNVFIPIAEQSGLIREVTECMVRQSIADLTRWRLSGVDPKIALNLSPRSLNWLELPDELASGIDAAALERGKFAFEITESKLLEQNARTVEILARLRMMGFELSIDDFGTGYSNIDSLREFPFSELKIDRSFVQNARLDPFAMSCIEASIKLARNLDMRVVAEGVETAEDLACVTTAGADHIQGFFIAKPMSAEDFLSWSLAAQGNRLTA